ncbi:ArsR family transcriptional regulator [Spongiactinospora gelatinilytica]|uniref:ArsR family transcriptional regulator n=1 Tax=Spongiactinospora gelatinilytica TaxID=2666298 RepID=A0A2W2I182_9ACTN|nr:winged helix-turn-helix domain-containing protein [Spongiactinospora gelatinilytica]PZG56650.1 ArsR family transcriptional regulator [Spongiactinospora gelatinilytica]
MADTADGAQPHPRWTFLTDHARVLRLIAADPRIRLRDIAAGTGITERAAGRIVGDLRQAGYIGQVRQGRHNLYAIVPGRYLPDPGHPAIPVQALLDLFTRREFRNGEPADAGG